MKPTTPTDLDGLRELVQSICNLQHERGIYDTHRAAPIRGYGQFNINAQTPTDAIMAEVERYTAEQLRLGRKQGFYAGAGYADAPQNEVAYACDLYIMTIDKIEAKEQDGSK